MKADRNIFQQPARLVGKLTFMPYYNMNWFRFQSPFHVIMALCGLVQSHPSWCPYPGCNMSTWGYNGWNILHCDWWPCPAVSLGKPDGISNFGELADTCVTLVLHVGHRFDRIDVTFDRYRDIWIKAGTSQMHSKHSRLIWRVVEHYFVSLPNNWTDFLAIPQNKTDLACFLLKHLIANALTDKLLVVSGSFKREDEVQNQVMDWILNS